MRRRTGFTLIEMLVVISILAVLFATLFPVFARARANARRAACVTQLSQLYKAAKMYSGDHDRTIVPARTRAQSTGTRGITWCVLLQPYIENEEILVCPDDPSPQPTARSICLPHSYGINYLIANRSRWGPSPFVASMSHIERVSDLILFFEMRGDVAQMGAGYYAHRLSRVAPRHNDIGNFAFLDGHVKGLRTQEVNSPLWWDPFAG